MFEAIVCQGVAVTGTTVVTYEPFPDGSLDVSVMFKPNDGDLYGQHIGVFGYSDFGNCLVEFRTRQGVNKDGSTLSMERFRVHHY